MFTIVCCVFFSLFFLFLLLCVFCYLLPSWRNKFYINARAEYLSYQSCFGSSNVGLRRDVNLCNETFSSKTATLQPLTNSVEKRRQYCLWEDSIIFNSLGSNVNFLCLRLLKAIMFWGCLSVSASAGQAKFASIMISRTSTDKISVNFVQWRSLKINWVMFEGRKVEVKVATRADVKTKTLAAISH